MPAMPAPRFVHPGLRPVPLAARHGTGGGRTCVLAAPPAAAAPPDPGASASPAAAGGALQEATQEEPADGRAAAALRAAAAYRAAAKNKTEAKTEAEAAVEPKRRPTGLPVSLGGAPEPEGEGEGQDATSAMAIAARVAKDTRETKETGVKVESVTFETVEKDYRPARTSWGVFERPANISEAYGGGRTLRPGQALESEEAKAARDKRFRESMAAFRESAGLVVDDAQLEAYDEAFARAEAHMDRGELNKAELAYQEASECVPYRSEKAGTALLRMAYAMDSQGEDRQAEARSLYQSLVAHPNGIVSKGARRMKDGFEAMTFLKADNKAYDSEHKSYWEDYVLPSVVREDAYFDPAASSSPVSEAPNVVVERVAAASVVALPLLAFALFAAS